MLRAFGGGAGRLGLAACMAAWRMASSAWMSWRRRAVPRCIIERKRVPAVAAGARPWRLLGGRAQGARLGLQHALGEGHGRVAVVGLLLEHEHGDRRVVAEECPLQRLAGEEDQAPALGLGRLGQAVDAGGDEGAELLALEQALDQRLVAALGERGGAGRQAGGEAVGDLEPVLGAGALAWAALPPNSTAAIR